MIFIKRIKQDALVILDKSGERAIGFFQGKDGSKKQFKRKIYRKNEYWNAYFIYENKKHYIYKEFITRIF